MTRSCTAASEDSSKNRILVYYYIPGVSKADEQRQREREGELADQAVGHGLRSGEGTSVGTKAYAAPFDPISARGWIKKKTGSMRKKTKT